MYYLKNSLNKELTLLAGWAPASPRNCRHFKEPDVLPCNSSSFADFNDRKSTISVTKRVWSSCLRSSGRFFWRCLKTLHQYIFFLTKPDIPTWSHLDNRICSLKTKLDWKRRCKQKRRRKRKSQLSSSWKRKCQQRWKRKRKCQQNRRWNRKFQKKMRRERRSSKTMTLVQNV